MLDSREYEVEYLDGYTETISANIIAENLLSQVDEEGNRQMMIDKIIDHKSDETAVKIDDGYITTNSGRQKRKWTTKGWQL